MRGKAYLGAIFATAMLAACGRVGFAPDALMENPGADQFLNVIGSACGSQRIGDQSLAFLLSVNSNDTYFIDETTKLYFGDVSRQQYASDINAQYPSDTNQGAIDCVFSKLPR
ncbi:MAG: hypothetical protein P8Y27_16560 [Chromatiaceae bacterium]|jgi:hypothetical protein